MNLEIEEIKKVSKTEMEIEDLPVSDENPKIDLNPPENTTETLKNKKQEEKSTKEEIEELKESAEQVRKSQKIEEKDIFEETDDSEIEIEVNNLVTFKRFSDQFREHKIIKGKYLGDLLEIFNFFHYFDDLMDGPIFELEELWASFAYQEDHYLDLVQDMHMVVIDVILENLEDYKNKFEV